MNSDQSFQYALALFQKMGSDYFQGLKEFDLFCSLFEKKKEVDLFFEHPSLEIALKKRLIETVLKKIKMHKFLKAFLFIIVEKKIFFLRRLIFEHYKVLVEKKRGLLQAIIEFSPQENDKTIQSVKNYFEQMLSKKILWTFVKKESVIAGFSVCVDGKFYDARLHNQLQKMKAKFIS